ncbi:MAG: hypothetical protein IPP62_05990 [bacterium]|nr:hypothetical protein [bacterium]
MGLGAIQRVAVDGDFAFVTDLARGLVIVNVRNPSGLRPEAHGADVPGRAFGVTYADGFAYVANLARDSGSSILPIRTPRKPLVR